MTFQCRLNRNTDELVGLCRGLLADGAVNQNEVEYLLQWLIANHEFANEFPFHDIYSRVSDALQDGVLDSDEERDILAVVHALAGGEVIPQQGLTSASTFLPFCAPPPTIEFANVFLLTGVFQYGSRAAVGSAIVQHGGTLSSSISRKVRYLVVGNVGSRDWLHSSFGTKIQRAVELRESGVPVSIVGEDHWRAQLPA